MTGMMFQLLAMLALIFPMLAQTDAIAVSVTRTVHLNPDQITFNLVFGVDFDVSLDQVLQATQSLGLAPRDLVGISSQQSGPSPNQPRLVYQFAFPAAFSKLKRPFDKLNALRRSLASR